MDDYNSRQHAENFPPEKHVQVTGILIDRDPASGETLLSFGDLEGTLFWMRRSEGEGLMRLLRDALAE